MNDFSHRTDGELETLGLVAAQTLASPAYPLRSEQRAALVRDAEAYEASRQAAYRAQMQARKAVKTKDAARETLLRTLASVAHTLYAPDSGVEASALLAVGFAPRHEGAGRHRAAETVEAVRAEPSLTGTVRVDWKRGRNPRTAIFQVYASSDDGEWRFVGATSRESVVLPDFPPGREAWFRVVATTSTTEAPPSASVVVYLGASSSARRKAA